MLHFFSDNPKSKFAACRSMVAEPSFQMQSFAALVGSGDAINVRATPSDNGRSTSGQVLHAP